MITQEQALEIAKKETVNRQLKIGESSLTQRIYNITEDCWVFVIPKREIMIISSEVILISKSTGKVVYTGSAYDEG